MTEADKIGFLANLNKMHAQRTIQEGSFDPKNYQAVYRLYLLAYGREDLARQAQTAALERFVDSKVTR